MENPSRSSYGATAVIFGTNTTIAFLTRGVAHDAADSPTMLPRDPPGSQRVFLPDRQPGSSFRCVEFFGHSCTTVQLSSGSNSVIAVAISVVVFPKSFWRSTPSWLMMNVITPELRYSAGYA